MVPSVYDHKTEESYRPSPTIANYMDRKLRFLDKERNLLHAGKDLPEDDKKERRNLDREKVYILNKHIFPAMANLTVFLEYIAGNEKLQKVFDDDLEQLFFGVSDQNPKEKKRVFGRFINAAISWNWKKENDNNFRLALINIMQMLIFNFMISFALFEMDPTISNTIVGPDLGRAYAWTKSFAANVKLKDSEIKRKVLF